MRRWPPTELHDAGRASSSASMAAVAACFRAKSPTAIGVDSICRPCSLPDCPPRRRGRDVDSETVAHKRGGSIPLIAELLAIHGIHGGNVAQRGERPALADVVDATDRNGSSSPCVGARRTGRARGERRAVRCKDGVASALRILGAATSSEPRDRVVPMSAQRVGLPFTAAAQAAGLKSRVTAHSGRVGLASELTSRGASPT